MMANDKSQTVVCGATPILLRASLSAAFIAFGIQLSLNYVLEQYACQAASRTMLHVVSVCAILLAVAGATIGVSVLRNLPAERDEEGGHPHDRAHFQALLAVGFNISFGVGIIAVAIPPWLVPPC
ncbi:MAG: hypothetical protein JO119_19540 [Acidobacteria bacterium]|nr:hypothetical protein [Acidobacteriota bacterium]